MSLEFAPGYRMLAWFCAEDFSQSVLSKFDAEIQEMRKRHFQRIKIKNTFLGIAFGKFDIVLDFSCKSGKVASHFVCEIARSLEKIGISSSFSSMLTKEVKLEVSKEASQKDFHVRCYEFLRPLKSIEEICQAVEEKIGDMRSSTKMDIRLLWNDSAYPLVLTVSGSVASETMKATAEIREHIIEFLAETSTFPVLEYGFEDEEGDELSVFSFVKLRNITDKLVAPNDTRFSRSDDGVFSISGFYAGVVGWYDFCAGYVANSLSKIQEMIFSFKEQNKSKIYKTSTLWLRQTSRK